MARQASICSVPSAMLHPCLENPWLYRPRLVLCPRSSVARGAGTKLRSSTCCSGLRVEIEPLCETRKVPGSQASQHGGEQTALSHSRLASGHGMEASRLVFAGCACPNFSTDCRRVLHLCSRQTCRGEGAW